MIIIKNKGFLLLLSICLISGCDSDKPIQKFVDQNVVLGSGVNFDNAKLVVLNSESGNEVPICTPTVDYRQSYQSNDLKKQNGSEYKTEMTMQPCKTEFIITDNTDLRSALELSRIPIIGKIRKNNELIDARYVVTVTALYKGSHCNSVSSGGYQFERCSRR